MQWPDWKNETAVIVGTGPSAADKYLDCVRGKARVFVIKSTWRLAPWADALYGVDRGWWIANDGALEFAGLKFSPSPSVCHTYPDVRQVRLKTKAQILNDEIGVIGCGLRSGGGHSGFQAINLAIQFGAKRILLIGFDMTLANGTHWIANDRGVAASDDMRVRAWRDAMDGCAQQFVALGIEVVNCTMLSALTAYPKVPLAEAL